MHHGVMKTKWKKNKKIKCARGGSPCVDPRADWDTVHKELCF